MNAKPIIFCFMVLWCCSLSRAQLPTSTQGSIGGLTSGISKPRQQCRDFAFEYSLPFWSQDAVAIFLSVARVQ